MPFMVIVMVWYFVGDNGKVMSELILSSCCACSGFSGTDTMVTYKGVFWASCAIWYIRYFQFWRNSVTNAKIKYFVQNMWWFWFRKWVWVAGRTQGRLWILVFCLGIMGVLVPAPLLEFRYFTIPFFLIALHTKIPEEIELGTSFCMTILYLILNAFTMYLFLFRPFHWANDPGGIQRFMWWKFCHLLFSHIT